MRNPEPGWKLSRCRKFLAITHILHRQFETEAFIKKNIISFLMRRHRLPDFQVHVLEKQFCTSLGMEAVVRARSVA